MGDKRNKIGIIILILLILILVITGTILFINSGKVSDKNKKEPVIGSDNNYKISDKEEELNGTQIVDNDNMKAPHCIDNICINNVVMYYADKKGRITYTITNNSTEEASGYLKLNFGSNSLVISYKNINSGEVFETVTYFDDKLFENVSDYKLEKVDDKEKSKIVVIK